jgi:hypothetical protein
LLEDMLLAIDKRLLQRIASEKPERGSKEAVRHHVGVLKDESDLEETLERERGHCELEERMGRLR